MKRMLLPVLALTPLLAASDVVVVCDVDELEAALSPRGADAEPREIVVSPGEYSLSSPLTIYPDTTLTLMDGVIVRADFSRNAGMLNDGHYDADGFVCHGGSGCSHGGYSQCHGIVIQGGVWDRNSETDILSNAFVFRHASGVVVRDMEVLHCSNHFFNFSGSCNVLVSNVVFSSPVRYRGDDDSFWTNYSFGDENRYRTIEAIHTDFLNQAGEPGVFPRDGTPSSGILVEDCLFDGVFSGVGTHHLNDETKGEGLYVSNCIFSNLLYYAVIAFSFDDVAVENCDVTGGAGLLSA